MIAVGGGGFGQLFQPGAAEAQHGETDAGGGEPEGGVRERPERQGQLLADPEATQRLAPEQVVRLMRLVLGWLGGRGTASVERLIRRMAEGLGSLQGGRHLWWIASHSLLIWTVLGVAPFLVAIRALGIDLGSFERTLSAAFVTLTAVGIAVALPSAPGFLGPYHLAAREALRRFGVTEELALALGALSHAVFWLTTTGPRSTQASGCRPSWLVTVSWS